MKYTGVQINDNQAHEPVEGFRARFFHTGEMTIAYWNIDQGSVLPEHHHVHTQVVQMIDGEFEMTIGGETHVYRAGNVVEIPSNVPHSGRALTDCVIHDIFLPMREEYRALDD